MTHFLPQETIRRKRDGASLEQSEISSFVRGISDHSVTEGQIAAFAMAIYFRKFGLDERIAMTLAMRDSGTVLDWSALPARCSTSIPPAASATPSRCFWRRPSPPAAAMCR
jgi:thymidine phosphorylase